MPEVLNQIAQGLPTGSTRHLPHGGISPIEEIIEEARNGRMYILVDDEDRENEGDLIIPAQMVTPAAVNFMATHGRGLICLALSKARVDELGLPLMSKHNGTLHETAFTVSIEALDGVTTGISAADRARTIATAIDSSKGPQYLVTPGHVFPLVAKSGGVLTRAGHTEAAVDVARLAGLNPSGVICEIMNDDGTMARLDDLVSFGQLHGLKIGTIEDLIAYRRRHDREIEKVVDRPFASRWGDDWRLQTYRSEASGTETVVLVKGDVNPNEATLVRMHVADMLTDMLGGAGPRAAYLERAMKLIDREKLGVIVLLNQGSSIANGASALSADFKPEAESRDYGVGAQILAELGIRDVVLLTDSHENTGSLECHGFTVVGQRPIAPIELSIATDAIGSKASDIASFAVTGISRIEQESVLSCVA